MAEPFANQMGWVGTANGLLLWPAADERMASIGASSIRQTSPRPRRSMRACSRQLVCRTRIAI